MQHYGAGVLVDDTKVNGSASIPFHANSIFIRSEKKNCVLTRGCNIQDLTVSPRNGIQKTPYIQHEHKYVDY